MNSVHIYNYTVHVRIHVHAATYCPHLFSTCTHSILFTSWTPSLTPLTHTHTHTHTQHARTHARTHTCTHTHTQHTHTHTHTYTHTHTHMRARASLEKASSSLLFFTTLFDRLAESLEPPLEDSAPPQLLDADVQNSVLGLFTRSCLLEFHSLTFPQLTRFHDRFGEFIRDKSNWDVPLAGKVRASMHVVLHMYLFFFFTTLQLRMIHSEVKAIYGRCTLPPPPKMVSQSTYYIGGNICK